MIRTAKIAPMSVPDKMSDDEWNQVRSTGSRAMQILRERGKSNPVNAPGDVTARHHGLRIDYSERGQMLPLVSDDGVFLCDVNADRRPSLTIEAVGRSVMVIRNWTDDPNADIELHDYKPGEWLKAFRADRPG